jgi:hypothetical protein
MTRLARGTGRMSKNWTTAAGLMTNAAGVNRRAPRKAPAIRDTAEANSPPARAWRIDGPAALIRFPAVKDCSYSRKCGGCHV